MFPLINSISLCIRGSRRVANNEEIMIRSLCETVKKQWTFIRDGCINIHKCKFWYTPIASIDAGRSEPVCKQSEAFVCIYTLEKQWHLK